jgi:hypothetical protein
MPSRIRRVDYFYVRVKDQPGAAYEILSQLAAQGVNLLAFTAVPIGADRAQLALFPEDPGKLVRSAAQWGLVLDGPHPALLVQGDDELGALAAVHGRLYQAGIDVYASSGVTDGRGTYGYVIYVREDQVQEAYRALEV